MFATEVVNNKLETLSRLQPSGTGLAGGFRLVSA
jgi:hypothetical protein